jgi:hypothetical protein
VNGSQEKGTGFADRRRKRRSRGGVLRKDALPVPTEKEIAVPEISRFFGIIVRMYVETGVQHHTPHFHAYYEEAAAVFGLDPIELLAGALPRRQLRLVEAWAELHQQELVTDWQLLQGGQAPRPIEPLG